jgi:hypothetical protein
MNVLKRMSSPTPRLFRVLRNSGLILAAIGGVLVTTTYDLPMFLVTLGEYMIVAGSVASAVSQAVVEGNGN